MSVCCLRTTATATVRIKTKTSAFFLRSSARQQQEPLRRSTQTYIHAHTHGRRGLMMSSGSEEKKFPYRLIDSHLHVWTPGEAPFPYAKGQTAPPGLQESG